MQCWKWVFDIYGPLDWKRADLLFARVNQYQSTGDSPLKDFVLFKDPSEIETREERELSVLSALGWKPDEEE